MAFCLLSVTVEVQFEDLCFDGAVKQLSAHVSKSWYMQAWLFREVGDFQSAQNNSTWVKHRLLLHCLAKAALLVRNELTCQVSIFCVDNKFD